MGPEHSGIAVMLIVLLMLIIYKTQSDRAAISKKIIKRNKIKGDRAEMVELAKRFIGKECLIYTLNSQLEGTVKEVTEGAILVEKKGVCEAVNIDFITRIREFPRNKNGKKKSVVLD